MSIIFLRHGKLDLPYKNHKEMPFSMLNDIANSRTNPSIDINFLKKTLKYLEPFLENVDCIVVSPFNRGIETGVIISNFIERKNKRKINIFIENDLREVFFDPEKIIDGLNYIPDLPQLNNLVFEAMSGLRNGAEASISAFNRIKKIIKKYNYSDKIILIITHSFLLETLEMYIKNKDIKNFHGSYEELIKVHKINYLSGFIIDKNLNIIDFIDV